MLGFNAFISIGIVIVSFNCREQMVRDLFCFLFVILILVVTFLLNYVVGIKQRSSSYSQLSET